MNDDKLQKSVEECALIYADAQVELMSLALQRAFINGALKGLEIAYMREALAAANDESAKPAA